VGSSARFHCPAHWPLDGRGRLVVAEVGHVAGGGAVAGGRLQYLQQRVGVDIRLNFGKTEFIKCNGRTM